MTFKTAASLILCFFCITILRSQTSYTRLQIGDKVPDLIFKNVMNVSKGIVHTADYRGKLLILDFWNLACTPCVAAFPKMEKLQEEFEGQLNILLVNSINPYQQLQKAGFPDDIKSPIIRNSKLPIVMLDKNMVSKKDQTEPPPLDQLFPHETEPYHVWISSDGTVLAMTNGQYTTRQTISEYFKTNKIELPIVRMAEDLKIDHSKNGNVSFLQEGNKVVLENIVYSSFFTRNLYAAKSAGSIVDSLTNGLVGKRLSGSFLDVYWRNCLSEVSAELNQFNDRFVLEVKEPNRFISPIDHSNMLEWEKNNKYYYELRLPEFFFGDRQLDYWDRNILLNKYIKQDWERFYRVTTKAEIRHIPCLILKTTDTLKLECSRTDYFYEENENGSQTMVNAPLNTFIEKFRTFNARNQSPLPLIDETGVSEKTVCLKLTASYNNIPALKRQLNKYGLSIQQEVRAVKVLVIRDEF